MMIKRVSVDIGAHHGTGKSSALSGVPPPPHTSWKTKKPRSLKRGLYCRLEVLHRQSCLQLSIKTGQAHRLAFPSPLYLALLKQPFQHAEPEPETIVEDVDVFKPAYGKLASEPCHAFSQSYIVGPPVLFDPRVAATRSYVERGRPSALAHRDHLFSSEGSEETPVSIGAPKRS